MPSQENRLMNAILLYTEQEQHYKHNNPIGSINDWQAIELKKQYYTELKNHFRRNLNKPEIATRRFLKNEIRKLLVKTNPNPINVILNGRFSRWLRNLLTGDRPSIISHNNAIKHLQYQIDHTRNLANITDAIKHAGFTQDISTTLGKMISQGLNSFHLRYQDIRHPDTDYILYFNKLTGGNSYIFERFDAAARPKNFLTVYPEQNNWQSFYRSSEIQISASEAAGLVNGRSICRNENEWLFLDKTNSLNPFKKQIFNLENALKKLPLKQMSKQEYNNLLKALKAGGSKELFFLLHDSEKKYRIHSSPSNQTIQITDIQSNSPVDVSKILSTIKKQENKIANSVNKPQETAKIDFTRRKH